MPLYPLGQPVRLSTTVTDNTGAPADAGALTLRLYRGATLVQTYLSPTHDGVGLYHQDVPVTDLVAAGHYRYDWTATGANSGATSDVLDVFDPATAPRLVSLADAKEFLRITGTANNALLDALVAWASARICVEVGGTAATVTDRVVIDGPEFVLPRVPVRSVTAVSAVSPLAPTVAVSGLWVSSPDGGVVNAGVQWVCGAYDVTYVAGRDEVPAGVAQATLTLIRHYWNQSQAHGSATYGDAGFGTDFQGLPRAVTNALGSVPRLPGVA